jgi:hypothetical protein
MPRIFSGSLFVDRNWRLQPLDGFYPADIPVEVCQLFEKMALDLYADGTRRYGARAIINLMRWHFMYQYKGVENQPFKINDKWAPDLARWVMDKHPHMRGFFETRALRRPRLRNYRAGDKNDDARVD